MTNTDDTQSASLDPREVERFGRLAQEWWDPAGKFRPLHRIGSVRLGFLRDAIASHHGRDPLAARPLGGLALIDIGCGGGLICEPLARLGAAVTGIDPAERNIEAARRHALGSGLAIDYQATTAEAMARARQSFDVVVCLEVVEHVPDAGRFVATLGQLVRPGGLLALSTINRTLKSFALAIVGAEYVLRWLPRGTHRWDRFVTPEELRRHVAAAGLQPTTQRGMVYDPLADRWSLSGDLDVNYLLAASRPPQLARSG